MGAFPSTVLPAPIVFSRYSPLNKRLKCILRKVFLFFMLHAYFFSFLLSAVCCFALRLPLSLFFFFAFVLYSPTHTNKAHSPHQLSASGFNCILLSCIFLGFYQKYFSSPPVRMRRVGEKRRTRTQKTRDVLVAFLCVCVCVCVYVCVCWFVGVCGSSRYLLVFIFFSTLLRR